MAKAGDGFLRRSQRADALYRHNNCVNASTVSDQFRITSPSALCTARHDRSDNPHMPACFIAASPNPK
jgi:hypothetical protein